MVFIPKRRRKVIYGQLRKHLGEVFHELAKHKEARIEEGHLMPDHVHMCISIPPKYAVASVVGYIKGKSAIAIARNFLGVSHLIYVVVAGCVGERWTVQPRYFTA